MTMFQYRWMKQPEPGLFVSPNYHTDVFGIERVNCAEEGCGEQAGVVDVLVYTRSLQYQYQCQRGHAFCVLYHLASNPHEKVLTLSLPETMVLSRTHVLPIPRQETSTYAFCAHCGKMATHLVQGYDRDLKTFHKVGVCEIDAIRYQSEKWREWVWKMDWRFFTWCGPCTTYSLADVGDSTLTLEEYDPVREVSISLTVPWKYARPYAPLSSELWTLRDPHRWALVRDGQEG